MLNWLEKHGVTLFGYGVSFGGVILLGDMPDSLFFGILLLIAGSHIVVVGSR